MNQYLQISFDEANNISSLSDLIKFNTQIINLVSCRFLFYGILFFHWLDLYWNIMPNLQWTTVKEGSQLFNLGPLAGDPANHHIGFHAMDITLWLGMVALFLAGIGTAMKGNLLPVKDPKLGECLAFENY